MTNTMIHHTEFSFMQKIKKIKILQVDGTDGNGYYGTGYSIRVREKSE